MCKSMKDYCVESVVKILDVLSACLPFRIFRNQIAIDEVLYKINFYKGQ